MEWRKVQGASCRSARVYAEVKNDVIEWHDDGHVIVLELKQNEVYVTTVMCPKECKCSHADADCVVTFFVEAYGLDVNVGTCPAAEKIQVAWTFIEKSKDLEGCQVWITPVDDPLFSAFKGDFS